MRQLFFIFVWTCNVIPLTYSQCTSVQASLARINAHWNDHVLSEEEISLVPPDARVGELIGMHLQLVIDRLEKATSGYTLSEAQLARRYAALERLKSYTRAGVFPINTVANEPVPIFKDERGTWCAVGHMIYTSGDHALAETVATELNLGYLAELTVQYPALLLWAEFHGFFEEELAWIQPVYPCNKEILPGETIHPRCHGEPSGSFLADPLLCIPFTPADAYTYGDAYRFESPDWVFVGIPDCLPAGFYKQFVYAHSASGTDTLEYFTTIIDPDSLVFSVVVEGDPSQCTASLSLDVSGGYPPYEYYIYTLGGGFVDTSQICKGLYWVQLLDSMYCILFDTIEILGVTPTNEIVKQEFAIFPNPTTGVIKVDPAPQLTSTYEILDSAGRMLREGGLSGGQDQIEVGAIPNGLYTLMLFDSADRILHQQRFILVR